MKKNDEVVKLAEYDNSKGLLMKEAIIKANQMKLRILSNIEINKRLVDGDYSKNNSMYPCHTGTLIAYESPGLPFGKTVKFNELEIVVPLKFQGKVDCALVCNHPDFKLKDNKVTIGTSARCIAFARKDGWYIPDKEFGVPNGDKSNLSNSSARYLWRRSSSFSGLLARGGYSRLVVAYDDDGDGDYCRLGVFCSRRSKKIGKCNHKWIRVCKICGEERRL